MKRPSFQFYPGDWSSNPNLRRCTFAEKGVWVEVLCLMHDQPEYGVLRWPLKEIAEAVKCRPADLEALVRKDVLKGHDKALTVPFVYTPRSGRKDGAPVVLIAAQPGPVWYSSRMVKDEYVSTTRANNGASSDTPKGPPKTAPKASPEPSPMGGIGEAPKATPNPSPLPSPLVRVSGQAPRAAPSSSSSSSVKEEPPIPPRGLKPVAVGLKSWLEGEKAAGRKAIPESDPVFEYADEVGIPREFLALGWTEFRHRYTQPDAKKYKDWRAVFRKAVRGNWLKLWFLDGNGYRLTTAGLQAQRSAERVAA